MCHFGIIIILFTFLGRFIDASATPNQEITVQFTNTNVSEIEIQNAVSEIQKKLQKLGAENFYVGHDKNGNLKITYYSGRDVKSIEQVLNNSSDLSVLLTTDNSSNHQNSDKRSLQDYRLNVSKIQKKNQKNDWGFDGVQIVEHNQKTDRFNSLKKSVSGLLKHSATLHQLVKTVCKINSGVFLLDNKNTYEIPEARAGPLS
ncbi:hypothetical protein BWZ20_12515 [Winogradskyella sp. J14-2]|nr:hypothetical protein BWZ20_12515 [Winogradskyella sp. J14-2]